MTGSFHNSKTNVPTGADFIDGILATNSWADGTIFYSVPQTVAEYGNNYGSGEHAGFFPITNAMGVVIDYALNKDVGSAADDGFSIEGFTNLDVQFTSGTQAHIRLAQSSVDPFNIGTAIGYYPGNNQTAGDVWFFNTTSNYTAPVTGDYANLTILHEIGHAMGLEHAHEDGAHGEIPSQYDAMEYSIMSYRSFLGGPSGNGYSNETFGFAQSFMMLDIAALQHMYGADFTTNSGNTTYSWNPNSGNTMVNGVAAISPGANRIFATIWDGGGKDTYDLSAYADDLILDLRPGAISLFSDGQLAGLGTNKKAQGNIYNALQFNADARSLIENGTGGSGDDTIIGNSAKNVLKGNSGSDFLKGSGGGDTLKGGQGKDTLKGGLHGDTLRGDNGKDNLFGESGKDKLFGGNQNDKLTGGAKKDTLTGGGGADTFRYVKISDSKLGSNSDVIKDFTVGVDHIGLSNLSGTQFTFNANGFSGTGPSIKTNKTGNNLQVLIDVDGDSNTDMRITLEGINSVSASDFFL